MVYLWLNFRLIYQALELCHITLTVYYNFSFRCVEREKFSDTVKLTHAEVHALESKLAGGGDHDNHHEGGGIFSVSSNRTSNKTTPRMAMHGPISPKRKAEEEYKKIFKMSIHGPPPGLVPLTFSKYEKKAGIFIKRWM